jgi:nicotinate-nucleotide adenylyltransferase
MSFSQYAPDHLPPVQRLGLYGGSFDPIHIGHLILAREALEQLALDAIVFLPALLSPHKEGTPPIAAPDRWDMVVAAIQGENRFFVDDLEIRRTGVSYTIDTVRTYRTRFPQAGIHYLLGGDNLPALHTWREFAALQKLIRFVVLERGMAGEVPEGAELIARRVGISSTEIRNRVASGRSIRYLVTEMVHEIILSRRLYAL